jgi:hypothetical protein
MKASAAAAVDIRQLVDLLAEDALLVADRGRFGRDCNLPRRGAAKVAPFLAALGR